MIERVAAAIMDSAVSPQIRARWDDQPEEVRTHWRLAARAAIAAMREPSEAMIKEGAYGSGEDSAGVACGAWKAMIDEALKQKEVSS